VRQFFKSYSTILQASNV